MRDEDLLNKFRVVVKEEINEAVEPISEELANLMVEVRGSVRSTLEEHSKMLKEISKKLENGKDNIHRLDKRLSETEGRLGIQPPPELQIIK